MDIRALKAFEEIVAEDFTGVYVVDQDRKVLFWNKAAEDITGYKASEIVGKRCPETGLNHTDGFGTPLCHGLCPLLKTLRSGESHGDAVLAQTKSGNRIALRVRFIPIKDNGKTVAVAELFEREGKSDELTEKALTELAFSASHDYLTRLPGRSYIDKFLESKLDLLHFENQQFAVLFLDFDDFKMINDRYGHGAGDVVLKTMAKVITRDSRSDDLMGRYGGEEFVGVFAVNSIDEAETVAERIRSDIENSIIPFEGQQLHITASLGVTMAKSGDTAELIIRRVDRLMYQSKRLGKNQVTSDKW